jgi:uncharacterized protein (DUF1800 family)
MSVKKLSPSAYEWLSRCTYGVTDELATRFLKFGAHDRERWTQFVRDQLTQESFSDVETEKRIEKLKLKTLGMTVPQLWNEHFLASRKMAQLPERQSAMTLTPEQEKRSRRARRETALEPVFELEQATWIRIIYSPFQVFERLVEFWHDHFHVFAYEGRVVAGFIALNRDVIRKNAFGNFRQMLGEVCRNPAMLVYLDNAFNQSSNPNENFARELFELHTLGAENYLGTIDREKVRKTGDGQPEGYVDGDVYEAARAFTGWRVEDGSAGLKSNTGQFYYSDAWHDRFQKVILGRRFPEHQPPMKDGEDVLDLLCSHAGTARFIVRKLCRRFLMDQPPEIFVQKTADAFLARRNSPTQIRDTLFDILSSDEFILVKASKFKRPVDFFASLIRASSISFEPSEKFISGVNRAGQRLFGWKTPDGPPDEASPWQSPQSLIERWRFAQQIIFTELDKNSLRRLLPAERPTPAVLVEEISNRFLGPRSNKALESVLLERASGGRRVDAELPEQMVAERVDRIVEVLVMSPEFQVR